MKTLLEILGFSSLDEKEKKVLQRLRDEAIEEKANDELNDSVGKGISDTLDALRQKPLAVERSLEKIASPRHSPTYAIAFTGIACVSFFLFYGERIKPSHLPTCGPLGVFKPKSGSSGMDRECA